MNWRGILALLLLCSLAIAEEKTSGDWKYSVNESGEGVILGYTGPGGDVEIPAEIDGLAIKHIGREAFLGNEALTGITIPDSITTIGNQAFHLCANLKSAHLGNSIENIDDSAFRRCANLEEINLPESLKRIGSTAFDMLRTPNNLRNIVIPDGVESIGESAFRDCNPEVAAAIPSRFDSSKDAILGKILPTGDKGRGAVDYKADGDSTEQSKGSATSLTVDGVTYENVTLKNEYPRSFFIKHDGGTAFVDKSKLTEEQTAELLGSPAAETSPRAGKTTASGHSTVATNGEKEAEAKKDPDVVDSSEGLFIEAKPENLENESERKFYEACGKADTQIIHAMLKDNPGLAKVTLKGQTYRQIVPHLNGGNWGYKPVESRRSTLLWLIDHSEKTPERIEAIKALVEAGADPNVTTSERGTNGAKNIITDPSKLLPDELDYLLTKGADPHSGWCVGNTMPVMNLSLSYLAEKDPQKKKESAELLRVYTKHKVDLSTEGGNMGTGQMGGKLAEAGVVNSAKQVIELSQDQELAAIFAGN